MNFSKLPVASESILRKYRFGTNISEYNAEFFIDRFQEHFLVVVK